MEREIIINWISRHLCYANHDAQTMYQVGGQDSGPRVAKGSLRVVVLGLLRGTGKHLNPSI